MTSRIKKLSILIIAAVMLVAMAFAGAASADVTKYTSNEWNDLASAPTSGSYLITDGTAKIAPKNLSSSQLILTGDLTLDFSGYTTGFDGVASDSNGEVGALLGNVSIGTHKLEIIGLNMTSVKATSYGSYIGGILGYVLGDGGMLNFTNCHIVNCTIAGSDHVGGLVGMVSKPVGAFTKSVSVNVEDCSLKHCDVVSGSFDVGGLVGLANTANFARCNVTNSTVASTGNIDCGRVGGLVGFAYSASFESCGIENTSMYANNSDGGDVGGLVGQTSDGVSKIENSVVKNCAIVAGSNRVGGLVGNVGNGIAKNITNCHIVNCTIAGNEYVGGLVGFIFGSTPDVSGWSDNNVDNSAVRGSAISTNLVCGNKDMYAYCTADVNQNFIYNGTTYADTITLNKSDDTECLLDANFWKSISYTYATSTRGVPSAKVTNLGSYGQIGGYGVGSATYTVTYDGNGADIGTAPVDSTKYKGGSQVTVADKGNLARTGYEFNGWNTKQDGTGTLYQPEVSISVTQDIILYAQWTEKYIYNATEWNGLGDTLTFSTAGTIYIVDADTTHVINPKTSATVSATSVTLDFSGYKGTFAGHEGSGNSGDKGALFDSVTINSGNTLNITGLTMTSVNVTSSGGEDGGIGGIIGKVDSPPAATLNFTNCHLVNCSISGTSLISNRVGGLVGFGGSANVNVQDCSAIHCDVVSGGKNVGGLVGYANIISFVRCNVTNSTVASTGYTKGSIKGGQQAGGMFGGATNLISFETCGVENCSIYANVSAAGGLAGYGGNQNGISKIEDCEVKNCMIVSGGNSVGGLTGGAGPASNIGNCHVVNCTISGTFNVGGLVGLVTSVTDCSNNAVKNSAVNGTNPTNVHLDCGTHPGEAGCTDTTGSYLNNGTAGQPTIIVYPHTVSFQPVPDYFGVITITKLSGIGLRTESKNAAAYVVITKQPLVFDPCNGSSTTYDGTVQLGDATITAEKPVRAGYSFSGWNLTSSAGTMLTDKDGTLQASVVGYTNASGQWNNASGVSVNLFANWTANTTLVTFQNENDTSLQIFTYDSPAVATAVPDVKEGYLFSGWYDADAVQVFNETNALNTSAATYANGTKWAYKNPTLTLWENYTEDKKYTITNQSSDPVKGYTTVNQTLSAAEKDITATAYAYAGYRFINWTCINITESANNPYIFTMPEKNVTLTANFAANVSTVTFDYNGLNETQSQTITETFNESVILPVPATLVKDGYVFNWKDADGANITDSTYTSNGKWNYTGLNGSTVTFRANFTIINQNTSVNSGGTAEFGGTNTTAINETVKQQSKVEHVVLQNVSGLDSGTTVTFVGNTSIDKEMPTSAHHVKNSEVTVFSINVDKKPQGKATVNVTVTFASEADANTNKDKVSVWHFNETVGKWDTSALPILSKQQNAEKVTYNVEIESFSPFGITIETPYSEPSYSGSTKQTGYTQILSEGQVVPTITPTAAPTAAPTQVTPTVKPTTQATTQSTQSSPAPVAGILAGLGAAALVLVRMRK